MGYSYFFSVCYEILLYNIIYIIYIIYNIIPATTTTGQGYKLQIE